MQYLRGPLRFKRSDSRIRLIDLFGAHDPDTADVRRQLRELRIELASRGHADSSDTSETLSALQSELHELRQAVSSVAHADKGLTEDDKSKMLTALREQFAEVLVSEYEERSSLALAEKRGLVPIRRSLELAGIRLRGELETLARRGNLNLVIGTLTTLIAVGLLIYMVVAQHAQIASVADLLSYYIPRVSTVIFIEIFGFFFLRLYKSGLAEMKYYQNELTNLTILGVAVEIAARDAEQKGFGDLPRILAECDRNRAIQANGDGATGNDHVLERAATVIQELSKLIPAAGK